LAGPASSFGDDSPCQPLCDSACHSSSEDTFVPVDEDEEEGNDLFGINNYEVEEATAVLEQDCRDEPMAKLTNTHHHQGPMPGTYKDRDKPPPVQDAGVEWPALELASLELLSLCNDSGARQGFYDELLTLLP
jgi:hypothetical protein